MPCPGGSGSCRRRARRRLGIRALRPSLAIGGGADVGVRPRIARGDHGMSIAARRPAHLANCRPTLLVGRGPPAHALRGAAFAAMPRPGAFAPAARIAPRSTRADASAGRVRPTATAGRRRRGATRLLIAPSRWSPRAGGISGAGTAARPLSPLDITGWRGAPNTGSRPRRAICGSEHPLHGPRHRPGQVAMRAGVASSPPARARRRRRRAARARDALAHARACADLRRVHARRGARIRRRRRDLAGDAALSVRPVDDGARASGHGAFSLAAAGGDPRRRSSDVGRPTSNGRADRVLASIGANEALRTGTYSKTLTFTLSTTSP